ncbi:serine/threonine-protein kinase pim-2-like [Astyanax mexicanus]|uniref:Serine/threonine-protein kinase pim-2-like n=1 Tax=Astyanax mexicanus TaxID=7994 RepID=A0A8T2MIZ9_ASTMX|nr:serine/threonine-protein kinase pim-2-like [Astyanax mexicanus]
MDNACAFWTSACVLEGPYTEFPGTTQYLPPEWFTRGSYQPEPSTVWHRPLRDAVWKMPFQEKHRDHHEEAPHTCPPVSP